MNTSTKQIAPLVFENKLKDKNMSICLCKTLSPVLQLSRFLGLFPITWIHKDDKCVFKKSLLWSIYTLMITCLYIYQVGSSVDFLNMTKKKSLLILLNNVTNAIYGIYVIILTLISFIGQSKWIKTLNELLPILKNGLFCRSSMKTVIFVQYGFITLLVIVIILEASFLSWLHLSENYHTLGIDIYVNRILQIVQFVFYVLVFTIISMIIGILACFEKLTISALRYVPVHPMKGIDETNNERDFLGIIHYQLCKGEHPCSTKLLKLSCAELVEHLRILHEDISICIYKFNSCLNPQFLFHTVVELAVLIIHWYAVIAYIAYNFKNPYAPTIHVLNCLFVVLHTIGVFLFLKNAQHLKNMVKDDCSSGIEENGSDEVMEENENGELETRNDVNNENENLERKKRNRKADV
ncbi:hypothetical protein NQ314_000489, partial [Rhamnusium bicolor]